jgi:hypothetical protein
MSRYKTTSGLRPHLARAKIARFSATAIASLGWYALLLQLYLVVVTARTAGISVATAVINYFSFFTISTNLLIALVLTLSLKIAPSKASTFARRPTVQSAAAVYIAIVGIVYSLALRNLWAPEGLQKIADVILHDAVPLLYLLYWLMFVRKGADGDKDNSKDSLRFRDIPVWLAYPALYLVYSLARGAITGIYLYPFIDVGKFGYAHVALNAFVILCAFLGVSFLLVAVACWIPPRESSI